MRTRIGQQGTYCLGSMQYLITTSSAMTKTSHPNCPPLNLLIQLFFTNPPWQGASAYDIVTKHFSGKRHFVSSLSFSLVPSWIKLRDMEVCVDWMQVNSVPEVVQYVHAMHYDAQLL